MVIRNVPDKAPPTSRDAGAAADSPVTSAPPTVPARIIAFLLSCGRAVSAPLRLPRQQGSEPAGMRRYKFQAVVAVVPAQDRSADALPGPDWHGVIRAGSSLGRSHGMFSALVTDWDQIGTGSIADAGEPHAVATIVAFGPDPAQSLPVGGIFALWRGRDVGLGIVTRRVFV